MKDRLITFPRERKHLINKPKIPVLKYFNAFLYVSKRERDIVERLLAPHQAGTVHYLSLGAEGSNARPQIPSDAFFARKHRCLNWKTRAAQIVSSHPIRRYQPDGFGLLKGQHHRLQAFREDPVVSLYNLAVLAGLAYLRERTIVVRELG